ncbi:hypothetical protein Tsubulata_031869, partial [Turnera subulata]
GGGAKETAAGNAAASCNRSRNELAQSSSDIGKANSLASTWSTSLVVG